MATVSVVEHRWLRPSEDDVEGRLNRSSLCYYRGVISLPQTQMKGSGWPLHFCVLFMFRGGAYWGRGGILKFPEHFIFPQMYRGTLLTGWGWESWTVNLSRCSVASLPMLTGHMFNTQHQNEREGVCVYVHACHSFMTVFQVVWTHDLASASLVLRLQYQPDWRSLLGGRTPPHTHLSLFVLKHFKGKKHHRPCCWSHVVVYHACSPMKLFQGPMVLNPWLTSLLSLGGPLHRLSGWFLFNHQPSQT